MGRFTPPGCTPVEELLRRSTGDRTRVAPRTRHEAIVAARARTDAERREAAEYAAEHGDMAASRQFGVSKPSICHWRAAFGIEARGRMRGGSPSKGATRRPAPVDLASITPLPVGADGSVVCAWCDLDLGVSPAGAEMARRVHDRQCPRNPTNHEHRRLIAEMTGGRKARRVAL